MKRSKLSAPRAVPGIVHGVLRSPGKPLSPPVRAHMESRFGKDFSQVRVHTGEAAAEASQAVAARAFTAGRSIVFGAGQYQPETGAGRKLIAHELTHVVQQGAGTGLPTQVGRSGDPAEREARQAAQSVALGSPVAVEPSSAQPSVQCEAAEDEKKPDLFPKRALRELLPLVKAGERQTPKERAFGGAAEMKTALGEAAKQDEKKTKGALGKIAGGLAGKSPPPGSTLEGAAKEAGQEGINKILGLILPSGVDAEVDLEGGGKVSLEVFELIEKARKLKKKKQEDRQKAEQR